MKPTYKELEKENQKLLKAHISQKRIHEEIINNQRFKIQELEKELAVVRKHILYLQGKKCSICQGFTEYACADCRMDLKITVYVCGKKECGNRHAEVCPHELQERLLIEEKISQDKNSELKIMSDKIEELQSLKSYSTGEVDSDADLIIKLIESDNSIYNPFECSVKVKSVLSSIHQKYRGELGEIAEAFQEALVETVDLYSLKQEKIIGFSSEEIKAIRVKEALTKLTKLIGGK